MAMGVHVVVMAGGHVEMVGWPTIVVSSGRMCCKVPVSKLPKNCITFCNSVLLLLTISSSNVSSSVLSKHLVVVLRVFLMLFLMCSRKTDFGQFPISEQLGCVVF